MPSAVTKDIKAEENKNNQLSIRTTAVENLNPGSWAGIAVAAAVIYGLTKVADYALGKFGEWKDAGFPPLGGTQLVVMKPENGEDLTTLMGNLVNDISDKVGSDIGVLLIQKDAIAGTELNGGYDWLPMGIQMPGSPLVLFDFFYAKQGSLHANSNVNGGMAFFRTGGAVAIETVNLGQPDEYHTFYFGKK